MNFSTRMVLVVTLMLAFHAGLAAQETTTAPETTTAAATTTADAPSSSTPRAKSSYEIRGEFSQLLRQSPDELPTILTLDPTLLSSEPFLARYPELARFVAENPEVRHHPGFYLGEFEMIRRDGLQNILEPVLIFFVFAMIAFALAWLVRTIIEQKRWNRLSRTQSEVHNKILDRFGTTAELLEYVKTPAGTKFLESAPIPLHTESGTPNPPLARVLWSIQIGVVVSAAAIGMLLVSLRYADETGKGLFTLGVIGLCVGVGFAGSAALSIFLSRRLGLLQPPPSEDAGLVQ